MYFECTKLNTVTGYATKDAVPFCLILYYNPHPHVTTIIHNYFLRCVTSAQLTTTYTFVTKVT
jgi:hypothetical protein